ncbi:polysaccharide biosynthesis/export family protein [Flavisolibacter nicotianae]|uniref:polysaccharide biosynthesis/export family protein n=1 Tax=Flavisolibacter nicotianae TaxID=2364882 RepID=UPI000EAE2C2B|nr:polysaccharide biosynthesis/export family protein [Flavisolibacter nicotianae]
MGRISFSRILRFCFGISVLSLLASCASVSKATYFNGLSDGDVQRAEEALDQPIQKSDILSIGVTSLNPEASAVFNMPNLPAGSSFSSAGTSGLASASGYLVNSEGVIQFPMLGAIKAEGMTKKSLAAYITRQLTEKKLLLDPIVSVRQLNFHVTVLGEVGKPTVITVPNEKINIMEAVGMAGDLTLYANRDRVLLIREEGGQKIVRRIDLTSPRALSSPYYNLKNGDIIYAETNTSKIRATSESRQYLPIIISALSVVAIALDRILR